jgi:hypothetical protein
MGSPGKAYSLCGEFNDFSKIVLCVVKLMGKHRGLPSNTDAALDGQFHRIFGILEQLQETGKKQKEARAGGLPGAVSAIAASAEGVQRRIALQREGMANPYEVVGADEDDDAPPDTPKAQPAEPSLAAMEGSVLRPK